MKKKDRKTGVLLMLFLACLLVFLGSGLMLLRSRSVLSDENEAFEILAVRVSAEQTAAEAEPATVNALVAVEDGAEQQDAPAVMAKYAQLYAENQDLFGWIFLSGTAINYPVMYTPEEPEYYLRRAFDGSSSHSGVPFVGDGYALGTRNLILYGHNLRNGTMFSQLERYEDKAFWQEHQTILLDTLYEHREYTIFSVFHSRVYSDNTSGVFRYYDYGDIETESVFDEYVANCQASALYDTGVSVAPGDELLTLSTCGYFSSSGRIVVVAKRVE